jgi:hypothetical protein
VDSAVKRLPTITLLLVLAMLILIADQRLFADEYPAFKTEGTVESYGFYYTGKFIQNTYMSFLHNEKWTTDILQVALKLSGADFTQCKSMVIEILNPSTDKPQDAFVLISQDGFRDDWIRAKKFKLHMKLREGSWWEVNRADQAQSCWPEHGHEEFSSEPCR